MPNAAHTFPPAQADYLRATGGGRGGARTRRAAAETSLRDGMPPVYEQALRGTCVANAVVALAEYYGDCKTRLSVQYLYAAAKDLERAGMERNLAALASGAPLDAAFEAALHAPLAQLRMLADANGGMAAPVVRPYLQRFADGVRERFDADGGSLLASAFRALETRGVCKYALWPYAAARATPVFGRASGAPAFPPGTHEDAAKRRIVSGLYLLPAPNSVDEIRGLLAGANGRRSMPVCVTVETFAGCDGAADGVFRLPEAREDGAGGLVTDRAWTGRHGLLIVGSKDDPAWPGGGYFTVRNSFGETWGDGGYGKMPYAYLECFALESGTILQDLVDYTGDGYGGLTPRPVAGKGRRWPLWAKLLANAGVALAIAAGVIAVGVAFDDPLGVRRHTPPPLHVVPKGDHDAPVACVVRMTHFVRGEAEKKIAVLLPDEVKAATRLKDLTGVSLMFTASRKRLLACARVLQRHLPDCEVYLSGRNTCLEIVGKDENPDFWVSEPPVEPAKPLRNGTNPSTETEKTEKETDK